MGYFLFAIKVLLCQDYIDRNDYRVLGEQIKLSPGTWTLADDNTLTKVD